MNLDGGTATVSHWFLSIAIAAYPEMGTTRRHLKAVVAQALLY